MMSLRPGDISLNQQLGEMNIIRKKFMDGVGDPVAIQARPSVWNLTYGTSYEKLYPNNETLFNLKGGKSKNAYNGFNKFTEIQKEIDDYHFSLNKDL